MDHDLLNIYKDLKKKGLSKEQDEKIRLELENSSSHKMPDRSENRVDLNSEQHPTAIYGYNDFSCLQNMTESPSSHNMIIRSIEKLLERDRLREKDGFPRKIRIGKLIKPTKGGKDKIVVVPTTVEEKFLHDPTFKQSDEGGNDAGGTGDEQEGEVIGEQPVHDESEGEGEGPGEGESGDHDLESNAYDLGRILSEQFNLPNLQDKGQKRSILRYQYDLTDKNRGFGQILDKKATLKRIVQTNISLGRLDPDKPIDTNEFLISPRDKVYRILSKEKEYESQAMIFFVRDYSGSMGGKATELIVSQHVLIYSWLLYQYDTRVETRFILHDTEAKQVKDFYSYYNLKVAGGTKVATAFKLINDIVEKESYASQYNIYIFYGTDGDDWDTEGKETVPEIKKSLEYTNRLGITISEHSYTKSKTEVERYMDKSGLLKEKKNLIKLDVMSEDSDDTRIIEGIRKLIAE